MPKLKRAAIIGAEITNLNVRAEKHGPDEQGLGVDLSLKMQIQLKDIGLLYPDKAPDWSFLWDDEGMPSEATFSSMAWGQSFEGAKINIERNRGMDPESSEVVGRFGKLSGIKPKPGKMFEVRAQINVSGIEKEEIPFFADAYRGKVVHLKFNGCKTATAPAQATDDQGEILFDETAAA